MAALDPDPDDPDAATYDLGPNYHYVTRPVEGVTKNMTAITTDITAAMTPSSRILSYHDDKVTKTMMMADRNDDRSIRVLCTATTR